MENSLKNILEKMNSYTVHLSTHLLKKYAKKYKTSCFNEERLYSYIPFSSLFKIMADFLVGDQIKFIDLRFERWQVVGFRKARRRREVV